MQLFIQEFASEVALVMQEVDQALKVLSHESWSEQWGWLHGMYG